MIMRGDYLHYAWIYIISHKSDAADAFKIFPPGLR